MNLTKRQAEVLYFIERHIQQERRPPTRAEISKHFGWASPNAAEDHIKALRKKGALFTEVGLARGIRPAGVVA